ncbi:MAG: hypothetical protein WC975_15440 [Phycisphaerae bacterium]
MTWKIEFSRDACRFLRQNRVADDDIIEKVSLALKKFRGEDINLNIKKLTGDWEGNYRIRWGRMRIIIAVDFDAFLVQVLRVDWRGNIYK